MKGPIFFRVITIVAFAQILSAQTASKPEDGFLSPSKYVNAYFGFSLPLPQNTQLDLLVQNDPPRDVYRHFLFAANSSGKGYPVVVVGADEIRTSGNADPRRVLTSFGAQQVDTVRIGGKVFLRGKWQAENIFSVAYATSVRGYLLFISVSSYNQEVLNQFQKSVESLAFLNPVSAKQFAGPDSRPYGGPVTTAR